MQTEIAQLRADQEVPVEELRRQYADAAGAGWSEDGSTDGADAMAIEVGMRFMIQALIFVFVLLFLLFLLSFFFVSF